MKIKLRPVIIFTLLFFVSSICVFSQKIPVGVPGDNTIVCCEHHNPCKRYTLGKEYNDHMCNEHGIPIGCSSVEKSAKLNTSSPIVMGIVGAAVGALGGSLYTGVNGQTQAAVGAELGYGVFSALTLLTSPNKRSVVGNLVIAGAAGASLNVGIEGAKKAMSSSPSTEKTDNTAENALKGAGAAVIAEGINQLLFRRKDTKSDKSGVSNFNKKNRFLSNMYVSVSSDKIGIRARL